VEKCECGEFTSEIGCFDFFVLFVSFVVLLPQIGILPRITAVTAIGKTLTSPVECVAGKLHDLERGKGARLGGLLRGFADIDPRRLFSG
jgi:hypothetical protein